jgi:hypothetical protein
MSHRARSHASSLTSPSYGTNPISRWCRSSRIRTSSFGTELCPRCDLRTDLDRTEGRTLIVSSEVDGVLAIVPVTGSGG